MLPVSPASARLAHPAQPHSAGSPKSDTRRPVEVLTASGPEVRAALLKIRVASLAGALALSLCAMPVVLALAAVYNHTLSHLAGDAHAAAELREEGVVDGADSGDAAVAVVGVINAGMVAASVSMLVAQQRLALRLSGTGARPDRRMRLGELLLIVVFVGSRLAAALTDSRSSTAYSVGFSVVGGLVLWYSMSHLRRLTGRGGLLTVVVVLEFALIAAYVYVLLPWFFSSATSDVQRLVFRVLVHPLWTDLILAPARQFARRAPPGVRPEPLMIFLVSTMAGCNLLGRLMIASMHTVWGTVLAVAGVSAVEVFSRVTLFWRDAVYQAPFTRGGLRGAMQKLNGNRAREVQSDVLFLDEQLEIWSTIVIGVMLAAFRVGDSPAAPSGAAIAASVAAQVAVEGVTDMVPGLAASVVDARWTRWVRAGVVRRAQVVRKWPRLFWLVIVPLVTSHNVLWFCVNCFDPLNNVVYCAWSEHGGWWHRVPCSL